VHYLIDGYNITKSDLATKDLPLEKQREILESRLRTQSKTLLGASSSYTLVWDGSGGVGVVHDKGPNIAFAHTQSADDYIVEMVKKTGSHVGLITNDANLIARCKEAVGRSTLTVLPSSRLFEASTGRKIINQDKSDQMSRNIGLPSGADDITAFYKSELGID
jgi:hypothetical protein